MSQPLPFKNDLAASTLRNLQLDGIDSSRSQSVSSSVRSSLEQDTIPSTPQPSTSGTDKDLDGPLPAILQSFFPRVLVLASNDTEELVRLKGIYGGLHGLLRPFGERVVGNIITRDSVGASKSLSNFGVHFVPFFSDPRVNKRLPQIPNDNPSREAAPNGHIQPKSISASTTNLSQSHQAIDEVLNARLSRLELPDSKEKETSQGFELDEELSATNYYTLYLRKSLAGRYMVPHETFTHPVACLIAISSQSQAPIEILRDLYEATRHGRSGIPFWQSDEFLRYYLLIHDEDHDDMSKTTVLFEQMKRHFGLHCHLLRIRSVECKAGSEDGVKLPSQQWLSAAEEVDDMRRKEQNFGVDEFQQYLFDTDITTIRSFVREMITQSIIPFMEGRVAVWNDQVASRRRGISGRFMSLSKRWTAFGSNRGSKSTSSGSSSSSYDANSGTYSPESAEATMQRLADYAFMLRDWKLANSTYDILRADFNDDKAWKHNAIANEMAALSLLLRQQQPAAFRSKIETIDQMLDAATYSYLSRCSDPTGAIRCLLLAIELFRCRGETGIREAAKWAMRLLELSLLSPVPQCISCEQLAELFQSQNGNGDLRWCSRGRKAAFWNFLTSDVWLASERTSIAKNRLGSSKAMYAALENRDEIPPFPGMVDLWDHLHSRAYANEKDSSLEEENSETVRVDEQHEELDGVGNTAQANHRLSLGPSQLQSAEAVSLFQRLHEDTKQEDDGFT